MLKFQSVEEVKQYAEEHKKILVIYQSSVYDLTLFQKHHSGGKQVLQKYIGTKIDNIIFNPKIHNHKSSMIKVLERYLCGEVSGLSSTITSPNIQILSIRVAGCTSHSPCTNSPNTLQVPQYDNYSISKNSNHEHKKLSWSQNRIKLTPQARQKFVQKQLFVRKNTHQNIQSTPENLFEKQDTMVNKTIKQMHLSPKLITDILRIQKKYTLIKQVDSSLIS